MIIGLSSGNFYRIFPEISHNSLSGGLSFWKKEYGNAIEMHCSNEEIIDCFLGQDFDLSSFRFISVHAPKIASEKEEKIRRILEKLRLLKNRYGVCNFVFHIEGKTNWGLIFEFRDLPISVENMDSDKIKGKSLEDVGKIITKYGFNLTLDLQHCYTNDKSMKVARDFQKEFKEKIAEYHLSGFCEKFKHYLLFKTRQDEIIRALEKKEVPIIIESTFDEEGDARKEIDYIKTLL